MHIFGKGAGARGGDGGERGEQSLTALMLSGILFNKRAVISESSGRSRNLINKSFFIFIKSVIRELVCVYLCIYVLVYLRMRKRKSERDREREICICV